MPYQIVLLVFTTTTTHFLNGVVGGEESEVGTPATIDIFRFPWILSSQNDGILKRYLKRYNHPTPQNCGTFVPVNCRVN